MAVTKVLVFYRCEVELKDIISHYCMSVKQETLERDPVRWSWYAVDKSNKQYIEEDVQAFITADGFLIELDSLFWHIGNTAMSYFRNLLSTYTQHAQNARLDSAVIYFHE